MGTRGGDEPVLQSLLHGGPDGLVEGDEVFRDGHVFRREVVEIGADGERALHRNQEAELERRFAIWRVGDPGHHHARRVGVRESILKGEAVEGVSVVGGPDLDGAAHDADGASLFEGRPGRVTYNCPLAPEHSLDRRRSPDER